MQSRIEELLQAIIDGKSASELQPAQSRMEQQFIDIITGGHLSGTPQSRAEALLAQIQSGGGGEAVLIEKYVNSNGNYIAKNDNADGYSKVNVEVPNSYTILDEGKVVNGGQLVEQTARAEKITQNGTYGTTLNSSVVVDVPEPSGTILITENGTVDVTDYASANVSVQGGGALTWRDTLSVNWDFANPVNSHGQSSYRASGMIYTLDGWQLQDGIISFISGGIKLERYSSNTMGYFIQRYKNTATTAMVGRQCTLSVIVDGQLYYTTFTFNSTAGQQVKLDMMDDERCRIYRYGNNGELGVTVDITQDTSSHILQAIKLEAGSNQTLATLVNGVWILNNSMDADTEYIKARNGTVIWG